MKSTLTPRSTPILIDSRAGSGPRTITRGRLSGKVYKGLTDYPPLNDPAVARLVTLDSADVCMTGNGPTCTVSIGVEVKSLSDLLSSSDCGRLQATQIPAMITTYDIVYLAFYDAYRPGPEMQTSTGSVQSLLVQQRGAWVPARIGNRLVPYIFLEGLLLTFSALGIVVKHCSTAAEVAQWLHCLHRWWSKPWADHKSLRTFDRSSAFSPGAVDAAKTGTDRRHTLSLLPGVDAAHYNRARTAASLTGIGFERAMAVAAYFPSVHSMMTATAAEWSMVDGIGSTLAESIVRQIHAVSLAKTSAPKAAANRPKNS